MPLSILRVPPLVRHRVYEFIRRPHKFDPRQGLPTLVRFPMSYPAWERPCRATVPWSRPERLTVILQSYKRVINMDALARGLLACQCVVPVVITNNNPAYKLLYWLPVAG